MSQHVNSCSPILRILDPSAIRQIQSSQVIPSYESLVASLAHDSIDNGASRVHIKLQPASLRVTVIDDSEGVHPREWRKLFSKSTVPQGRGKTLQAIAAVACLELSSSRSDIYLRKTVRGGIVLEDSRGGAVSAPLFGGSHGVAIDVWELFHNLPVRRRAALQFPAVKLVDNVRRRIVAVALSNVHVHVTLEMNAGIVIFESPSRAKLSISLLQAAFATHRRLSWLPVNAEQGVYQLRGYIAELALSRATEAQIVSINGVPLDQSARVYKLLRKASRENLSQRMNIAPNARAHPAFVLQVQCPPGDVQVSDAEHGAIVVGHKNVDVEQFVADSVLGVLREQHAPSEPRANVTSGQGGHRVKSADKCQKNIQTALAIRARKRIWTDMQNHDFKEAMLDLNKFAKKPKLSTLETVLPQRPLSALELRSQRLSRAPSSSLSRRVRRPQTAAAVVTGLSKNLPDWKNPVFQHQGRAPKQVAAVRSGCSSSVKLLDMNKVRVEREAFRSMRVIGQVDLKFIMTTDERGTLYAIDQHAASERALFERLLRNLGQGRVLSQSLTPPMTLRLTAEQRSLVSRHWNDLHRWGWQLSQSTARGFYAGAVRVQGVPCIGPQGIAIESVDQFMAFVDALAEGASPVCVPTPFRDAIATAACHAAVRFGDVLSMAQCREIVQSMAKCDCPFSCAHGRPSIVPLAILKST